MQQVIYHNSVIYPRTRLRYKRDSVQYTGAIEG